MSYYAGSCDVAVIGAGHAGIEAALAAARERLLNAGFIEIQQQPARGALAHHRSRRHLNHRVCAGLAGLAVGAAILKALALP